jgi:hypothetical protein
VSGALPNDSSSRSTDAPRQIDVNPTLQVRPRRFIPSRTPSGSVWIWSGVIAVVAVLVLGGLYWTGLFSLLNSGSNACGYGNPGGECQGVGGPPFGFGTASQVKPATTTSGECAAMDFCYEIAVSEAGGGLIPRDLQLRMTTNNGVTLAIVSWYIDSANLAVNGFLSNTTNPSGTWLSTAGTGGTAAEMTSATSMTGAMEIWIDVSAGESPFGEGDIMTAFVQGPFAESILTTLP